VPPDCHDGNACTLDVCDPLAGCRYTTAVDGTFCDDRERCTNADVCRRGTCAGTPIPDCCHDDAGCTDGVVCTDDRCVTGTCAHLRVDARCGAAAECSANVCAPDAPGAGADGCVPHAVDEAFCSEDGDPCTRDVCRAITCLHEADGTAPACAALEAPLRATRALLDSADALATVVTEAVGRGCVQVTGTGACDVVSGEAGPGARLLQLLSATRTNLDTAALALEGRLGGGSPTDAVREPTHRLQIALAVVAETPEPVRAVLATLIQGRRRQLVAPAFARARSAEGRSLLRGTTALRTQLRRLLARQSARP
jgi:hypothetical protein